MTVVEKESQLDRLARQRDGLMLAFVVSWFVWGTLQFDQVARLIGHGPTTLIGGIGIAVWFLVLAMLVRQCIRIRSERRKLGGMGDELTRANSRRATVSGYYAMTIGVAAATMLMAGKVLDPMTIMQALCMLTAVPILRFVWLERASDV